MTVELNEERWQHIISAHPELTADVVDFIGLALRDPDIVRTDRRFAGTHIFTRWFEHLLGGKQLAVVVVTDAARSWIVTTYVTRRVRQGEIEWQRN